MNKQASSQASFLWQYIPDLIRDLLTKALIRILTLVILIITTSSVSFCQNDFPSISNLSNNLDTKGQEKIDKAKKLYTKAQKYIDKAEKIRAKGDSKRKEEKACEQNMKAELYFEIAHMKIFKVYKKRIVALSLDNPSIIDYTAENEAKKTYRKGKRLRKKAKTRNFTKGYELAKEGKAKEIESFDKFDALIASYTGAPTQQSEPTYTEDTFTQQPDTTELVDILSDDKISTAQDNQSFITYGGDLSAEEEPQQEIVEEVTEPVIIPEPVVEEKPVEIITEPVIEYKPEEKTITYNTDIQFYIQIAALNKRKSKEEVGKLYKGHKSIDVYTESGMYKYLIGSFNSYSAANSHKKQSGLKNAFIVAYLQGSRMNIKDAISQSGGR